MKKKIHLTGRVLFLVILIAVLFSYAMFQGGFVSWFLFYSFLPFALYSLCIAFYPIRTFSVQRQFNQEQFHVGETLTAALKIRTRFFFPIMHLMIEDVLPKSLQKCQQCKPSKILLTPLFKTAFSYEYILEHIPRGEHQFSTVRIKLTDFFGLIEKEASFQVENSILVYPRYVKMVYRKVGQRFEQGVAVSHIQLHRDTTMAVGIRDYQPGDRFSWINWKASARKNGLMTKEFEERQSEDIIIFLDRTPSLFFEEIVTFTASLVRTMMKRGVQTGLVSVGRDRVIFPARNGEAHLQELFYHLAKVQCDSEWSFARIIHKEIAHWNAAFSFCYITSSVDKELAASLESLAVKNVNVIVFIVKDKVTNIAKDEMAMIGQIERKGIIVKVVEERNFANALIEGGK
ncbi:DUF58 domain-containing protein [Bacillus alveayuensis]|uniref:DUF58 domain-containing protein n=1 Tax=Aeribacillus alveayuensis TaxID=279215 RepID=UPI0005D10833|nr:DUF58 domain-containing protein [Bacillus alveayuensis]